MRPLLLCAALVTCSATASQDTVKAIDLVKNYSSLVACSINGDSFKGVKFGSDFEKYYMVYWEGDYGCSGGSSSMGGIFTTVRVTRFGDMYIMPEVKQPNIKLVCADKLKTNGESVIVNGIQYSPTDHQRSPSQQVQYTLTLDPHAGKFSSIDENELPSEQISTACVRRVR
ncbi:hypothetical protein BZG05_10720 [Salinivibrio kushneri]|uniref:hypothetical protein n=1 Tax=Salinivibrio kushneri TaxID=1908198 RepID=UPI000988B81C|nr:hypothetical protein [Salinivibrio kushneri]OOE33497.1 hypothetical protein BZG05_10720 [Salinivibrio kushneri]